ncbi:hypothetical protein [Pedobacter sp. Bi27]|uniref:hypothetical protein n=1 Tax=Pedobacter sp. Bi27 TaxID=2822351 RepID=UPI001E47215F|nr:hypothetical protein [Pedobacter sp. Bi27]
MKYYIVAFSLFLMFYSIKANAVDGCLLPNNRVYTFQGLLGFYSSATSTPLASDFCSWTPTTGPSCSVCNGPLDFLGTCLIGTYTNGIYSNNFQMVLCNLDDYSWTLGAAAGIFGVFVIRRRNKQ